MMSRLFSNGMGRQLCRGLLTRTPIPKPPQYKHQEELSEICSDKPTLEGKIRELEQFASTDKSKQTFLLSKLFPAGPEPRALTTTKFAKESGIELSPALK